MIHCSLFQDDNSVTMRGTVHPFYRRLIVLNHFCLSGGMAKFLKSPAYKRHIKTLTWPIWCVVTCDEYESSLGDFWHIWIGEVEAACLHPLRNDTIRTIYKRAEKRYWEANAGVLQHNTSVKSSGCPVEPKRPLSFGTISACEGRLVGDLSMWQMLSCTMCHDAVPGFSDTSIAPAEILDTGSTHLLHTDTTEIRCEANDRPPMKPSRL